MRSGTVDNSDDDNSGSLKRTTGIPKPKKNFFGRG
jgi:hypothetical protein